MNNPVSNQSVLSKRLYEETQSVHSQIESHPFFLQFKDDQLDAERYLQYIVDLYEVYSALEEEIESHLDLPEIRAVYFNKLCRAKHLQQDIHSFEPVKKKPSKGARDYALHLRNLAQEQPFLLLAHAYLRYLGDLSGGRMLQKHVNAALSGGHDSFYDFQELLGPNAIGAKVVEFKNQWKKQLDALPFTEQQKELMIEEAKRGFEYTRQLLDQKE